MTERKKIIIAFAAFLAFMWIFTLISKSFYVSKLPMIQTEKPIKKYIEHLLEAQGMVIQGGDQAITALEGVRVENIFVRAGERVEEGTPLFQVDLEDLKETMKAMELEIKKLRMQINDAKANKALEEQKRLINQQRAQEDYADEENKTGTAVSRAEEAWNDAGYSLEDHLNNPVPITSESKRKQAWEKYSQWTKKQKILKEKIEELEKIITSLENPEEGHHLTEEEKAELEEAKKQIEDNRTALKEHENHEVKEPDFSDEDSAVLRWEEKKEALSDTAESAAYAKEDAYADKDSTLKNAGRTVDDSKFPGTSDSSIAISELEFAALEEQYGKYQDIVDHNGIISAEKGGMVTDILISVGGRIPGTASIMLTDDTLTCRFKVMLSGEQKKYINLGDTVEIKLDQGGKRIEATVDYLKENDASPGTYEAFLNLPEGKGIAGLSGTLTASVKDELFNHCIPAEALYSENNREYVYVVREREGILGKELYADKVSVTVKDRNSKFAALEEGVFNQDTEIITYTTEEISRGDVVRYQEQESSGE